jgi:hypothetical protein
MDCIYSEEYEEYSFYGVYELAIHLVECCGIEFDEAPKVFYETFKESLYFDFNDICNDLFIGKRCPIGVLEDSIESLFYMTELDYPDYSELIDWEEFQSELIHFQSINYLWWMIARRFKKFKPERHSIGLKQLEQYLISFVLKNDLTCVYYPDFQKPIPLTREFWSEIFTDCQHGEIVDPENEQSMKSLP